MTGKKTKVAGIVRSTFAENVRNLMELRYADSSNKPKAVAKDAGVTLSTIQRALAAENAPTLDTVEAIATAFRIEPYVLLTKNLNVKSIAKQTKRIATEAKAA